MALDQHRPDQDLAAWLTGSIYRAFRCNGCGRPIVAARTEWLHPTYVRSITARLGTPMVAHCSYQHCDNGITQHSEPVTSH
ncbi:hypothetical protein Kfla_2090 [Kribbella flavida DSM 17836]|uniref:Uncharacterized protein n=1 Tax=Kribbella flavida (strain DSM 17836 / JCM 10339 / NBRC 14399) TaxID=479435 RepID=D2PS48_KRIFD|nr:hypothetical protein [Kribbella flavida]ADB31172.1 hypothetical protein Kfla_2090 [Kribbella flavida DSM 17836]